MRLGSDVDEIFIDEVMDLGPELFDGFIFRGRMNPIRQKNHVKVFFEIDPKGTTGVTQVSDRVL
jgi:hypothetical protein